MIYLSCIEISSSLSEPERKSSLFLVGAASGDMLLFAPACCVSERRGQRQRRQRSLLED